MKQQHWIALAVALVLARSDTVEALDKQALSKLTQQFQLLPEPQLPAAAANAVRTADGLVRAEVAGVIVTTIAPRAPVAVLPVVGAILNVQPSLAPIIVPLAAQRVPGATTNLLALTARLAPAFSTQTIAGVQGALHQGEPRLSTDPSGNTRAVSPGPTAAPPASSQSSPGTIQGHQPVVPPKPVGAPLPTTAPQP